MHANICIHCFGYMTDRLDGWKKCPSCGWTYNVKERYMGINDIDWTDASIQITPHFSVKDALYLPTWSRLANESDGLNDEIKENIIALFNKMETVREYFGNNPINVHVTYRPPAYNKLIGGAANSNHMQGLAMDFDIAGISCDDVRTKIVDNKLLDLWDMRCENKPGSNWIHLDNGPVIYSRFFIP